MNSLRWIHFRSLSLNKAFKYNKKIHNNTCFPLKSFCSCKAEITATVLRQVISANDKASEALVLIERKMAKHFQNLRLSLPSFSTWQRLLSRL